MNFKNGIVFSVTFAVVALVAHAIALYVLGYSTNYLAFDVVSKSQYVLINVAVWSVFGFLNGLFADRGIK